MEKGKSRNKDNTLKKLIYNDKYLIFSALALAVLIWIFTSLSIGTAETRTIKLDVPIKLGDEVSDQLGMQYYTLQDTVGLSVTVSGPKYVIGQVGENDLKVSFDTSNVNRTGEQSIPIIVTNNSKTLDFDVSSTYPSNVQCYFDANSSKTFDVKINYDKTKAANGYYFDTPVLSEDKVIVTGPKTYVDKIDDVSVTVDFGERNDLTKMFNTDCKIELSGAGAYDSYLTVSPKADPEKTINTVSVTIPVLKNTTLPVAIQYEDVPKGFPDNTLKESFSVSSISAGVLDSANISSAVIGTISFSELNVGNNIFTFNVNNLSGIILNDDSITTITATVTVPSTYQAQSFDINANDVKIKSSSNKYNYNIKSLSTNRLTVVAPKGEKIKKSDILLTCDMTSVDSPGKYPVNVTIKKADNMWVYGEYTAEVEVREQRNSQ